MTNSAVTDTATIRPFRIDIPQADLDDLSARLGRTRWPGQSPESGWSRGVPLDYVQGLSRYWATGFDWRKQEAELNQFDQFLTTIAGQDIHFLHVRSPEPTARALILIHGWPSSPFEFIKVIGPLTDPRAYGLDPASAFHVVIPSLPGYGFSTPVTAPGAGNLFRVAQQFAELMDRLGYRQFAVHATDAGTGVAGMLPMVAPGRVIGIHLTGTLAAMPFGPAVDVSGLTAADRGRAERFNQFQADGLGYLHVQSTRPQTLAYALTDSPVGQLAWIVEKFQEWTDPAAASPEAAVGRDELLTTVSIFWFTGAGASSAHAVYDGMQAWRAMSAQSADGGDWSGAPGPPVGYAVFAADTTIRALADPTGQIAHWSEFDQGGHFPAMEAPTLLVADIREFFS
jgi:pimeloyl-ACP methyl ester carboxylesterase